MPAQPVASAAPAQVQVQVQQQAQQQQQSCVLGEITQETAETETLNTECDDPELNTMSWQVHLKIQSTDIFNFLHFLGAKSNRNRFGIDKSDKIVVVGAQIFVVHTYMYFQVRD